MYFKEKKASSKGKREINRRGKMSKPQNQDALKEVINVFKEDYKSPIKAFAWAKVINEWGRIIFVGIIFFIVIMIIFVPLLVEYRKDHAVMKNATRNVANHLTEIIKFVDIGKRSMEQRNTILAELMQTIDVSAGQHLDQKIIDGKLSNLASILKRCRDARRAFIGDFSESKNPHANPEVSESFEKLVDDGSSFAKDKPSASTFDEENKEWGSLCALCENEVKRTQNEQHQILETQRGIQKNIHFKN